ATFTPDADTDAGTASIRVGAGSYLDAAGNSGIMGASPSIPIDTRAPTLTITSDLSALKVGETATITFSFSEDPGNSFDASDISVSGGWLSDLGTTDSVRTATFTPYADTNAGSASIRVEGGVGSYTDAAGNDGGAGDTPTITYDTLAPDVPIFSTRASFSAAGVLYLDAYLNIVDAEDAVTIRRNGDSSYSFYFWTQVEAIAGLDHIPLEDVQAYIDLYAPGVWDDAYASRVDTLPIPDRQLHVSVNAEDGSTTVITFTDTLFNSVSKTIVGAGMAAEQVVQESLLLGDWGADNHLEDGTLEVSVQSTDLAGNVSLAVSSFILDTRPPVISTRSLSVNENTPAVGTAEISNGDSVTWALHGDGGDNARFAIDPESGAIRWLDDSGGNSGGNFGGDFEAATPSAAGSNTYTLTVSATDTAGNQSTQEISIYLLDVNEAPVPVLPAAPLVVAEDSRLAIADIRVSDADAGDNGLAWVWLSVAYGTLEVTVDAADGGLAESAISGNGGSNITLVGTAAAIHATLATLVYQCQANFNGNDTLTLYSSDGGNPAQSSSSQVTIHVTPVNDAPTLSGIPEGIVSISTGVVSTLNTFTVNDVDGANTVLFVTLTPANGSLGGFTAGNNGNGLGTTIVDGTVRLRGTAAAINTALAAATFTASAAGVASLAVRVSDVGVNDTNPASSSSRSFGFEVTGTPVLRISSGQDAWISQAESGVEVEVSFSNLASNDSVQLWLGNTLLGNSYTVTASDASTHQLVLSIASSDLGDDGSKSISATVTHSGTPLASNTLSFLLDTSAPATPTLALGAGLTAMVSAAAATASTGVMTVLAEAHSRVLVTFTDSNSHSVTKTLIGTGAALAVVLGSSDIGNGNIQLHEGAITIRATASDAAGNVSPVGSSSFTLDTTPLRIRSTAFSVPENLQAVAFLVTSPAEAGAFFALEGDGPDNQLFSLLNNQG
ncbi:MAG: Ig-like domain-containing protein, partial [Rhodoferax sp.]|nr:Ig-like domain-containing protein [Rhodoferax sp.]